MFWGNFMNDICICLINSNNPWYELHCNFKDALIDMEWLRWFLNENGFPPELAEDGYCFQQLDMLRTLLTEAIDYIISEKQLPKAIIDNMNHYLAGAAYFYEICAKDQKLQLSLAPQKIDWNYVYSEIVASFVKMIFNGDISRFRRCENPACRSVFYDGSKNRTRKWCCNACSSLIKVRRYRESKNQQQPNPTDFQ